VRVDGTEALAARLWALSEDLTGVRYAFATPATA